MLPVSLRSGSVHEMMCSIVLIMISEHGSSVVNEEFLRAFFSPPVKPSPLLKALTQQMRSQPLNEDQQEPGCKIPDPQLLFISSP